MFNRSNQRINYFKLLHRKAYQSSAQPYYFAYGRTALKIGLMNYAVPSGEKVLVPEFICCAALQPFKDLKLDIIFYPVNNDFSPQWDAVEKLLTPHITAIMMVHYFGLPQDVVRFINFSKEHNLLLIDDNSHGYGGIVMDKYLGEFGHIGFSSLRKSFPIYNGAVLYLNKKTDNIDKFPLEPINNIGLITKDLIGRVLDHFVVLKEQLLKKVEHNLSGDYSIQDWSIDSSSYKLLMKYDLSKVRSIRSEIYRTWANWCIERNQKPVFNLTDNTLAPLAMPLIFKDKQERNNWFAFFRKKHIAVFLWPDLPEELTRYENTGKYLYDRIMCFPIHLGMNADKLKSLLKKIIYN